MMALPQPPHPGPPPSIPQFYSGKNIFITGATGFMGKVLIERLLSTCPDIGRLYLLMRPKKDQLPEKRLGQLKQSQLFDVLKQEAPQQLDKLCIIPGDVGTPQLGMSMESLAQLQEVSVVFHSAATVRFDEQLGQAVDMNVRSVMRIMDLCDTLPNLQALVHVSTAYSNAPRDHVEERVYPPPVTVDELLAFSKSVPAHLLDDLIDKYIFPHPNTYTFTKAVAETAVVQHVHRGYSVAIFRPAIVIASVRKPFPGWVDNLNGPTGMVVGAGKGIMHVFCCNPSSRADLVPVDIVIDSLIAVGWETAIERSPEVKVYNVSSQENPLKWGGFGTLLRRYCREHAFDNVLWYPTGISTENKIAQQLLQLAFHTLPLHVIEYGTRLLGIKNRYNLSSACKKMHQMSELVSFFSCREWRFDTNNLHRLRERLSPADRQTYNLDFKSFSWDEAMKSFVKGTKTYLLKEKDKDLPEARRHLRRMKYLHYTVLLAAVLVLLRLLLRNPHVYELLAAFVRFILTMTTRGGSPLPLTSN